MDEPQTPLEKSFARARMIHELALQQAWKILTHDEQSACLGIAQRQYKLQEQRESCTRPLDLTANNPVHL